MTPDELNRTIEFIIESQARLAAAQEQDRQDRLEFQEWAKALAAEQRETNARLASTDARLAKLSVETARMLDHQSERMDRIDKLHADLLSQNRAFQQDARDFQKEALRLLNSILDRLIPPPLNLN